MIKSIKEIYKLDEVTIGLWFLFLSLLLFSPGPTMAKFPESSRIIVSPIWHKETNSTLQSYGN